MNNSSSQLPFSKAYSISRRFSYALIGVVTLILLVFAVLAIFVHIKRMNTKLNRQLEDMQKLSESSLEKPLWNFDFTTIDGFIDALFLNKSIVYVSVYEHSNMVAIRSHPEFRHRNFSYFQQSNLFITKISDIRYQDDKIGALQIAMSRRSIRQELMINILSIVALTILIIVAVSLTSIVITRRYISRPLLQLQQSATLIAHGDLDAYIDTSSRDETGRLAKDLTVMRDSIKQLFRALRDSKDQVEEYSRTLEQKVEERTTELAHAMHEAQQSRAAISPRPRSIRCTFPSSKSSAISATASGNCCSVSTSKKAGISSIS